MRSFRTLMVLKRQLAAFLQYILHIMPRWTDLHCVEAVKIIQREPSLQQQPIFLPRIQSFLRLVHEHFCEFVLHLLLEGFFFFYSTPVCALPCWKACAFVFEKLVVMSTLSTTFFHTVSITLSRLSDTLVIFLGHKPNHQLIFSSHSSWPRAACHNPFKVLSRMWSTACGLPVMNLEVFDRWVYLSLTPLLQMRMVLQLLCHAQHPKQVGTHNNHYCFLIYCSSPRPLRMVAMEHLAYDMLKWIASFP